MSELPGVECCGGLIEVQTWVRKHENDHERLDKILDKLLNRLPLWATMLFALASALIATLFTIAFR